MQSSALHRAATRANVVRCLLAPPSATFVASSDHPGVELILTATTCHYDTVRLSTVSSYLKCNAKPTNCGRSADQTPSKPATFLFILIVCRGAIRIEMWDFELSFKESSLSVCLPAEHLGFVAEFASGRDVNCALILFDDSISYMSKILCRSSNFYHLMTDNRCATCNQQAVITPVRTPLTHVCKR